MIWSKEVIGILVGPQWCLSELLNNLFVSWMQDRTIVMNQTSSIMRIETEICKSSSMIRMLTWTVKTVVDSTPRVNHSRSHKCAYIIPDFELWVETRSLRTNSPHDRRPSINCFDQVSLGSIDDVALVWLDVSGVLSYEHSHGTDPRRSCLHEASSAVSLSSMIELHHAWGDSTILLGNPWEA